jgi:signal transduction histidine kinase
MTTGNHAGEAHKAKAKSPDTLLSAAAAHEINNPLDAILNLLYLMEAETLTDKGRHYLNLIREEVCRLSLIAQKSLEPRKLVLVAETINVGELLDGVFGFYKEKFDSSGILVQTRYSANINLRVHSSELRQVLANLLLNSADAMPHGGTIQARVTEAREWGGQERKGIRVIVADNGSGIAPNALPHIFQPRFTTKSTGHGIGLSVVYDFLQSEGGLVRVKSSIQPDRHGTVFVLFLPSA